MSGEKWKPVRIRYELVTVIRELRLITTGKGKEPKCQSDQSGDLPFAVRGIRTVTVCGN